MNSEEQSAPKWVFAPRGSWWESKGPNKGMLVVAGVFFAKLGAASPSFYEVFERGKTGPTQIDAQVFENLIRGEALIRIYN